MVLSARAREPRRWSGGARSVAGVERWAPEEVVVTVTSPAVHWGVSVQVEPPAWAPGMAPQ